jgi:hypothetical protein
MNTTLPNSTPQEALQPCAPPRHPPSYHALHSSPSPPSVIAAPASPLARVLQRRMTQTIVTQVVREHMPIEHDHHTKI